MNQRILLVDDDPQLLDSYRRTLRHRFELHFAQGTSQALKCLEEEPFAVLVADMRMPGLDGLELLRLAQEMDPDMIRIMLTGDVDQRTAIDAVNEGRVFRFLTKPCIAEELAAALRDGLRQHQLLSAERELLEQTVKGAVSVLTDLIVNLDPNAMEGASELRAQAEALAAILQVPDAWEVGLAAQFARIGELTLSHELRGKIRSGQDLNAIEHGQLRRVPQLGEELLAKIPRLGNVARILRYQAKGFDGTGFPFDGVQGEHLPIGSRLLKPLMDLMRLERQHGNRKSALEALIARKSQYDPRVLAAIHDAPAAPVPLPARELMVSELKRDMVLAGDVCTTSGRLVMRRGTRLGYTHLLLLQNLVELLDLVEPISVHLA